MVLFSAFYTLIALFIFTSCAEADPTENEQDIHSKVAAILVKAPDILTSLRTYKGAGEQIREVSVYKVGV